MMHTTLFLFVEKPMTHSGGMCIFLNVCFFPSSFIFSFKALICCSCFKSPCYTHATSLPGVVLCFSFLSVLYCSSSSCVIFRLNGKSQTIAGSDTKKIVVAWAVSTVKKHKVQISGSLCSVGYFVPCFPCYWKGTQDVLVLRDAKMF